MSTTSVPEPRQSAQHLSLSFAGGTLRSTANEDQFVLDVEDGIGGIYIYLTPAEAAQWAGVLAAHAVGVTA